MSLTSYVQLILYTNIFAVILKLVFGTLLCYHNLGLLIVLFSVSVSVSFYTVFVWIKIIIIFSSWIFQQLSQLNSLFNQRRQRSTFLFKRSTLWHFGSKNQLRKIMWHMYTHILVA